MRICCATRADVQDFFKEQGPGDPHDLDRDGGGGGHVNLLENVNRFLSLFGIK